MQGQVMAVLGCLLLGGCGTIQEAYDSKLTLEQPVDWWRQLQGGEIAQQRPPPPGATDPYPNLGEIRPRPTPTDPATRQALIAELAGTRDRTRQEVAQEPIVWPVPDAPTVPPGPPPAPAAPVPAGVPPAPQAPAPPPPPGPEVSTMVFAGAAPAAATAPPPQPAPDPRPPPAFAPAARPAATPGARPGVAAPVPAGAVPALPAAAPPLPSLPGMPATTFAPATPRPRPSANFSFPPGSAVLPPAAEAALRALAARRAGATIQVRAGGEARSAAPDAQQAALPLALRRAGAITAALIGAGVPAASVRAEAVAAGREASARLVN